jgi:hypothetical protein
LFGTTWVVIRNPAAGFDKSITSRSFDLANARKTRLWTDDYSNLFQILK